MNFIRTPISFLMLFFFNTIAFGLPFGETEIGPNTFESANHAPGSSYICFETGNINYIYVYISDLSGGETGKVALYNSTIDQDIPRPASLLVQSSSQNLILGWNEFSIPSYYVFSGMTYWLCFFSSSNTSILRSHTDISDRTQFSPTSLLDFPLSYPTSQSLLARLSIYATSNQTTPTHTPTITDTITPSCTETLTIIPTFTFTPTSTSTTIVTLTPTPIISQTPTSTISPTASSTLTTTATLILTSTPTITATPIYTSTSLPTAIPDEIASGKLKSVYPNPAKDKIFFSFQLAQTSQIKIFIYNSQAEMVSKLSDHLNSGTNQFISWNCSNHGPGFYFARIVINNQSVEKRKLTLIK